MERPPQFQFEQPSNREPDRLQVNKELIRQSAEEVLNTLDTLPEFKEYENPTAMYQALPPEELIVRRENPDRLLALLAEKEPLELAFEGGTPYANAAAWTPDKDGALGLHNAFLEGFSHRNHVVMVYGFRKPDGFYYEHLPESQRSFAGIDRTRVRSVAGYVPAEAVRFVTVRIPIHSFPQERMTEEERDQLWDYEQDPSRPAFVYRGFLAKK